MANGKSLDINSSSYNGELALPYIAPAILSADTIANGYVTVHENVKFKAVLKKLSAANEIIDSANCTFTTTGGDLDLDEVVLTPTELQVNQELCKRDFRSDWEALQTGRSLMGDRIPPNFETFLLQFLAGKVSEGIERAIWQGNFNATTGAATGGIAPHFDGIFHNIVDNNGSLAATPTQLSTLTADNILGFVDTVVGNGSSAVLNDPNAKIFMSRKSLYLFQRALGGVTTDLGAASAPNQGAILTGAVPTTYMGYQIIAPAGMPNDALIFTTIDNLHFGCNLATDQIEATVVDMTLTDASDNVRVAMRFSGGTQVGNYGDVSTGYIYS